jgi:hypothetical protein
MAVGVTGIAVRPVISRLSRDSDAKGLGSAGLAQTCDTLPSAWKHRAGSPDETAVGDDPDRRNDHVQGICDPGVHKGRRRLRRRGRRNSNRDAASSSNWLDSLSRRPVSSDVELLGCGGRTGRPERPRDYRPCQAPSSASGTTPIPLGSGGRALEVDRSGPRSSDR